MRLQVQLHAFSARNARAELAQKVNDILYATTDDFVTNDDDDEAAVGAGLEDGVAA